MLENCVKVEGVVATSNPNTPRTEFDRNSQEIIVIVEGVPTGISELSAPPIGAVFDVNVQEIRVTWDELM